MQSCSDLEVDVNGDIFWVDKGILGTFSGRLSLFMDKLGDNFKTMRVIFHDFPGGADVFELIVKCCYNEGKINITPANFLLLHCGAKYMEMNDNFPGRSSLVCETNQYMKNVNCFTWNELLDCLKQCQRLFQELNDSETLRTILECVVDRGSLPCLPSCPSESSSGSYCADFSGDISVDSMRSNISQASWWFKDLEFLRIELLEKTVRVMISRELDHALISSFLFYYQRNRFPEASRDEKCKIMETVISLLYMLDGNFISIKRLLHILRVSSGLKQKACWINKLEIMIGRVLDEASVDDLLVPSINKANFYDVNVVLRFLQHLVTVNGKQLHIDRLKKIASLMDLYMLEVAPDPRLKPSKFLRLVTSLPGFARDSHDKIYEAIDIYLKVHTNLRSEDKIKLCCTVKCEKLSSGCLLHLAQNFKFPANAGDNALVLQQAGVGSLGIPICDGEKGNEDDDQDKKKDRLESLRKSKYRRVEGSMLKVLKKLQTRTSKIHVSEPGICSVTKGRFISAICR